MSKCAAGYDIPWDGPCATCGATEDEPCRIEEGRRSLKAGNAAAREIFKDVKLDPRIAAARNSK